LVEGAVAENHAGSPPLRPEAGLPPARLHPAATMERAGGAEGKGKREGGGK